MQFNQTLFHLRHILGQKQNKAIQNCPQSPTAEEARGPEECEKIAVSILEQVMSRLLHNVGTVSYRAYVFPVSTENENAVVTLESVAGLFAKKARQYLDEKKGLDTFDPTSDTHQVSLFLPSLVNGET